MNNDIVLKVAGTIINKIVYSNGLMLICYCEDDFVDENGNLYIMEAIVESNKFLQDRIIVSYDAFGNRFIDPITRDNWEEIGTEVGENVKNINYKKCKKIFNRNALNLSSSIVNTNLDELKKISNIINYKKGRFIFLGILLSFAFFLIISLFFIFSSVFLIKINDYLMLGDLLLCFIFWIFSSIKIINFSSKIPVRRILKAKYKTEILFLGIYETSEYNGCKRLGICGVIKDNNNYVEKKFLVALGCEQFLYNIKEGDILYKYAASRDYDYKGDCIFILKY